MKKSLLSLVVLAFVFGLFYYNVNITNAQSVTGTTTVSAQISLTQNLNVGSRGVEVKILQQFLKDEGYYTGKVDGKYGKKTARYVKDFQDDNDLVANGKVDAPTRALINSMLTGEEYPICLPTINGGACPQGGPTISKISGPQYLNINEQGTWSVNAYDKNGGNLSYAVVWGDETNMRGSASENGVPASAYTQQTATFTHSYSQAGVYNPTFYVTTPNTIYCVTYPCPGNGGTAQSSLSVTVGGTTSSLRPMIIKDVSSIKSVVPNGTANLYFGVKEINNFQYYLGSYHLGQWYKGDGVTTSGPLWINFSWPDSPDVDATFYDENNIERTIYIPGNGPNSTEYGWYFWIGQDGSSYYANSNHTTGLPNLSSSEALQPKHLARKAGSVSNNSLTVSAPNGGEKWVKGTQQAITWYGNGVGTSTHEIKLVPYRAPCVNNICPLYADRPPYVINPSVYGAYYNWYVGDVWEKGIGPTDGAYTIQVCQKGTNVCDTSDSYFTIASSVIKNYDLKVGAVHGGNRKIDAGSTSALIGEFTFTAPISSINVSQVDFIDFAKGDNGQFNASTVNDFKNASLWLGNTKLADASFVQNGVISFPSSSFVVPAGGVSKLTVKADVSSSPVYRVHALQLGGFSGGNVINWGEENHDYVMRDSEIEITNTTTSALDVRATQIDVLNTPIANGENKVNVTIKNFSNVATTDYNAVTTNLNVYNTSTNALVYSVGSGSGNILPGGTRVTKFESWVPPTQYSNFKLPSGTYRMEASVSGIGIKDNTSISQNLVIPAVIRNPGTLSIDPGSISANVGSSTRVKAMYTPSCDSPLGTACATVVTEVNPTWSIANTAIAGIDQAVPRCVVGYPCPNTITYINGLTVGTTLLTATYTESNGNIISKTISVSINGIVSSLNVLCSPMTDHSAVRGCVNQIVNAPVYKADSNSCVAYCKSQGANACEWEKSTGNCYAEFGSSCRVEDGYGGWEASVDSCRATAYTQPRSMFTANALDAFQSSVPVSNTNNVVTTKFVFTQFLQYGSRGEEVRELQKYLNERGYGAGVADGVFGDKVEDAVIEFQIDNKLKADGLVGYEMRNFLNK
jgi:peptidoglycan hydrolase-like protein with peptidoglycan-binding domain